jgi:hypothetical protein
MPRAAGISTRGADFLTDFAAGKRRMPGAGIESLGPRVLWLVLTDRGRSAHHFRL